VVDWGQPELTTAALESLAAMTPPPDLVIRVDNNSPGQSFATSKQRVTKRVRPRLWPRCKRPRRQGALERVLGLPSALKDELRRVH